MAFWLARVWTSYDQNIFWLVNPPAALQRGTRLRSLETVCEGLVNEPRTNPVFCLFFAGVEVVGVDGFRGKANNVETPSCQGAKTR